MPEHLQESNKLLVISDTGMAVIDGKPCAFGPVVREFEYLLNIFDEITWIGFLDKDLKKKSIFVEITDPRIQIIPLKKVGGKRILQRLSILLQYPNMIYIIRKYIIKNQYIHSRAPSHPAFISMLLSLFYRKKVFWHKYAGSWIDRAPVFYRIQRTFLKKLPLNSKITINGNWESKENILAFENPCLTEADRVMGETIILKKSKADSVNFCFVGALNDDKGVDKIIAAFSSLEKHRIGEINIVGGGKNMERYKEEARRSGQAITFHGFLNKEAIIDIYARSHFLLLPSKSEGFPKVVGEAMNYGCIPIVSNVSCIGQYIKHGSNGFLIHPNTTEKLARTIEESIFISNSLFLEMLQKNFTESAKFTYEYYVYRIKTDIFNLEKQTGR